MMGPALPASHAGERPLLRGWSHAVALVAALIATVGLALQSGDDPRRRLSSLVYGGSLIALYATSATYHIGRWHGRRLTILRALDHANIFLLIAGTYTPLCVNVLAGPLGTVVLVLIWCCAAVGVASSLFTLHLPRWATAGLYLGMGWLALVPAPRLVRLLPFRASLLLAGGGLLYTIGALVYVRRRPNPFPRVFGFHELFHLLVIAGSGAFLLAIWVWVVPFRRR